MTINTYQNRVQLGFGTNRVQKLTEGQLKELSKAKKLQNDCSYRKEDIELEAEKAVQ